MGLKLPQSDDDLEVNHDINVVPFIDVMLVLLIIFMVAAPLATVSVPVDLPSAVAEPKPQDTEPLYVTLQDDLTLTIGDEDEVELEQLGDTLEKKAEDKEQRILLRADKEVSYGDIMDVMNSLSRSGYLKVALIGMEAVSEDSK